MVQLCLHPLLLSCQSSLKKWESHHIHSHFRTSYAIHLCLLIQFKLSLSSRPVLSSRVCSLSVFTFTSAISTEFLLSIIAARGFFTPELLQHYRLRLNKGQTQALLFFRPVWLLWLIINLSNIDGLIRFQLQLPSVWHLIELGSGGIHYTSSLCS